MFIAIVGTRFSGKATIEQYLIANYGFIPLRLSSSGSLDNSISSPYGSEGTLRNLDSQSHDDSFASFASRFPKTPSRSRTSDPHAKHLSFLSLSPLPSPSPAASSNQSEECTFSNPEKMLKYVTQNWRTNFVTRDLTTRALIEMFVRRPFFLLISCDAPLLDRFYRARSLISVTLEEFVQDDDYLVFGHSRDAANGRTGESLQTFADMVNISVANTSPSVSLFYSQLDSLDLLNAEHLRPSWDSYFMTLASLASRRSNCMKRRVGAVLVRENRLISAGYNGTARGVRNCNEGGCPHCNVTAPSSAVVFDECVCLHAEENALLEAGRERIGNNCVLYCNTCPCLRCTVKIIQVGVKTVVYNLTYKVDATSALLFREAGVELRRFDPKKSFRLSTTEAEALVASASPPPEE